MKKWPYLLLCFLFLNIHPTPAQSQDGFIENTRNDIMLVGAAGATGAILGLSTLSFYDKPSVHVSNIWSGAAIGIALGVIYVAYNSAQKGTEELTSEHSSEEFDTRERSMWHAKLSESKSPQPAHFFTSLWTMTF
jgi:hypothetical protein